MRGGGTAGTAGRKIAFRSDSSINSTKIESILSAAGAEAGIDGAVCDTPNSPCPPQRLAANPNTQRIEEDVVLADFVSSTTCLQQLSPFLSQQHDFVLGFSRWAASRTKSGAHTLLASAQFSFSALVKQQQLCQNSSIFMHPHEWLMHGNGRLVSLRLRAGSGMPNELASCPNRAMAAIRPRRNRGDGTRNRMIDPRGVSRGFRSRAFGRAANIVTFLDATASVEPAQEETVSNSRRQENQKQNNEERFSVHDFSVLCVFRDRR
jgi:hypothetical protein